MDEVYARNKPIVYFLVLICNCSDYCETIFQKIIDYLKRPQMISAAFFDASPPDANNFFNVA